MAAEILFHEKATPSLAVNVSHIEADPFRNLPKLEIPHGFTLVYACLPDIIDTACLRIIEHLLDSDSNSRQLIGFHTDIQQAESGDLSIKTVSLCTADTIFIFEV